jgi:ERF superfamily protein
MDAQQLNIYQRINKVMQDVAYIKKNGRNNFTKQSYVSHDDVVALFREPLIQHGIVVTIEITSSSRKEIEEKNKISHFTEISARAWFINIDAPEDRTYIDVMAHGSDYNDLGPGKAMSYLKKYTLLNMFLVETGEKDAEYDSMGKNGATRNTSNNGVTNQKSSTPTDFYGRFQQVCKSKLYNPINSVLKETDLPTFASTDDFAKDILVNILHKQREELTKDLVDYFENNLDKIPDLVIKHVRDDLLLAN